MPLSAAHSWRRCNSSSRDQRRMHKEPQRILQDSACCVPPVLPVYAIRRGTHLEMGYSFFCFKMFLLKMTSQRGMEHHRRVPAINTAFNRFCAVKVPHRSNGKARHAPAGRHRSHWSGCTTAGAAAPPRLLPQGLVSHLTRPLRLTQPSCDCSHRVWCPWRASSQLWT